MNISRGTLFTPLPTARQLEARLKSGKWVKTDIGMQARCTKCGELWPADTEFFERHHISGLASACKACHAERKLRNARQQGETHGR